MAWWLLWWFLSVIAGSDAWLAPSLAACVAASGTREVSQEGFSQLRTLSGLTRSEMPGGFSNRDVLSSASGGRGAIKALATACKVLKVSWTTLTSISEEGFSFLVLGFC